MYSHVAVECSAVRTCQTCHFAVACEVLDMSLMQSFSETFLCGTFPQTWQEVSHGQSLNPLKILLLCVCED